jgi:cytochrome b pre-mRNA-processing protein 3
MIGSAKGGNLIGRLFGPDPTAAIARRLYEAVVAQARQPAFFAELEVPDTVDGRFEMVALHAHLLLRRLKDGGPATADLAQALFDVMFADMDASLREMGAGDLGVGRRVKQMAAAFYGRMAAYDAGLASSDDALARALRRNLYGTVAPSESSLSAVADYMRGVAARLARQSLERLSGGEVELGPAGPGGAGDQPMKNH